MGLALTWEQAAECPCARRTPAVITSITSTVLDRTQGRSTTDEPQPDCPVCDGRGYFHHSPQQIKGIVTSAESKPERFSMWGEHAVGMISVSLLPEHLPSYLDRFTLGTSVQLFRETRTRTSAVVENLRYPIVSRSLQLVGGATEVGATHAHKANADGTASANGGLTPGQDFVVTAEGAIDWSLGVASGTAPALGTRYSISYYAHPSYLVINHPHVARDTVVKHKKPQPGEVALPVNALCRLEFWGSAR